MTRKRERETGRMRRPVEIEEAKEKTRNERRRRRGRRKTFHLFTK